MREIIFNDKVALKKHKRFLSVHESFTRDSYSYQSERTTIFKVKNTYTFNDIIEASEWINRRLQYSDKKSGLSILKVCNDKKGEGLLETRETGSIYILDNCRVFAVTFLYKLKVEVMKNS